MQSLGQVIRKRREAMGLTITAVAAAVGVAKSYLSMIENQRVDRPPSKGLLQGLERTLGISDGELQRIADWQTTPEPIRERVARLSDDAKRGRDLAAWLKDSAEKRKSGGKDLDALYRSGQLGRRINAVLDTGSAADAAADHPADSADMLPVSYRVPLINLVAAGVPTQHTDLGYPDGTAEEHLAVPEAVGPDTFATRIIGESMQPNYVEGDIVVCSGSEKIKDGDDCFVRLEPDHDSTFKRVYFDQADNQIRLQPLNPAFEARVVNRETVAGMYKAIWKFSKL
jgi:SOS-response transcriptional repressor LexA